MIKIIELLCMIHNKEELPKIIKYNGKFYELYASGNEYKEQKTGKLLFANNVPTHLSDKVEVLYEDIDIPLIPDDELFLMQQNGADIRGFEYLDYNFKVLQEKINQVVKEFNEFRKEGK